MNRNCSACNIKIDINNYKKDRTVCISCYSENKRKNNNNRNLAQNQQPEIGIDNRKKMKIVDSVNTKRKEKLMTL